ncbi:MAG TPA: VOC family protein [Solirubrobacteraceae bacterium]|jgi:catechol 2,3-dioxygenase-like lactoylglutathione lyase family enzyme|nr:VOC family protein [Solirubrobacteraceae bacterium]
MSDSLVAGPADHVAISVANFEAMTEWYKTTFGLTEDLADRLDIPAAGIKGSLLMGPNGFRLEILSREGSVKHSGGHQDPTAAVLDQGYLHWGFLVSDLDAALARLEASGAKVTHPKDELPSHNVLFAIFEDPEGNMIEVIQPVPGNPDAAGRWSRLRYHQAINGVTAELSDED